MKKPVKSGLEKKIEKDIEHHVRLGIVCAFFAFGGSLGMFALNLAGNVSNIHLALFPIYLAVLGAACMIAIYIDLVEKDTLHYISLLLKEKNER